MGKSKKDKRSRRDADSDSEGDNVSLDVLKHEPSGHNELPTSTTSTSATDKQNKKKKKGKGKKVADDDSEDELDILTKAVAGKDELPPKPVRKTNQKGKPKMSAFQMLNMMSDSDDDEEDQVEDTLKEEVIENLKKSNKKDKKSKKVEEKEDFDSVLTSFSEMNVNKEVDIQQPAKKNKSKKEKKSKKMEDEEDFDAVLASFDDVNQQKQDEDLDDIHHPVKKAKDKKKKDKKRQVEEKVEDEDDIDAILASISYTDDPNAVPDPVSEIAEKMDSVSVQDENDADDAETGDGAVKTKAQKKKEKREKERQKKKEQKVKGDTKVKEDIEDSPRPESEDKTVEAKEPSPDIEEEDVDEASSKKKKDKKKKKTKEEKEEGAKKKPGKAKLKAMQEALAELKELEEKKKREEEEAEQRAEEARKSREEAARLEQEKKERAKQKKKERELRMKQEGKWLSDKQKADKRRAMQMLEMMKQQGIEVPQKTDETTGEEKKKKRVVYEKKKKRPQQQQEEPKVENEQEKEEEPVKEEEEEENLMNESSRESPASEIAEVKEEPEEEPVIPDEPKDHWADESEDEKSTETDATENKETDQKTAEVEEEEDEDEEEGAEEPEEESEDEEESEESSEEESSEDDVPYAEKVRLRAQERIQKRIEENEKARTTEVLRSPVVCVLGHVDTGKTKILDKLRRTHVQDGEAGGITQQIGATNVPVSAIKTQTEMCKEFSKTDLRLPGLLIIDTPGHESFSNLRSRGSSLCDIAVLVVDIMHGLEPQTIESIQLLKKRKTPFVVALNKVDRLFQWKTNPNADVVNTLKKQQKHTKDEFDERVKNIVLEFANQSLNVTLFYDNKNPKEWISMVPTSAHSGDGMGNLMALICELCQTMLPKRLAYSNELQATVMEVKALPGLGTTIDVCLVNGKLREGQTIVVAGQEGPIVTQIRGLLIPPPMKELRVKNQYEKVKEMRAAHGVKIIAKDLEKALAGLPLYAAYYPDEVEIVKEDVANQLKNVLNAIKLSERGVFVQASTLGSMEALLEFLKTSKIPYAGINIGPVHKKDVMRASVMLEHDVQFAVILAFDVKVERDAQDLADSLGVRIFTADIIYHLFDRFMEYREQYKQKKKEEFRHVAVFPCKMRILPQYIFNSRDPIVMGISVEAGVVRQGTPVCVPSKDFVELGRISSLEINNKPIETARKGQDVCIKIDPVPGEAPKMFGRHFEAEDMLMSSISRESIDAVKEYFRDEMQKTDWQLMIELKKIFKIS